MFQNVPLGLKELLSQGVSEMHSCEHGMSILFDLQRKRARQAGQKEVTMGDSKSLAHTRNHRP